MFLFGDLTELKARMTVVIESEEKTVKIIKKQIATMDLLMDALREDRQVAEKLCEKLERRPK